METMTFTNSKGQSVELGNNPPFILTKIEGTGAVDVNIQSQKSPYQDGSTYLDNTLEPRPISIEVMLLADTIGEMTENRHRLLKVFNPKLGPGRLVYQLGNIKREIEAISELAPVFSDAGDFKDTMQPGLIQLYCPNPFWRDLIETKEDISTEVGNFSFPWGIPPEGTELSIRTISFITNIYNPGDVETPVKIFLRARGTVENPIIENLNTGEYIKVKRTLSDGDVLEINTEFGNKRVEIIRSNGDRENVFHYIDYKSTFFSVEAGDTTIKYDAEIGENNLDVSIYYTPKYLGV